MSAIYVGADGLARKVKKGYVGVDGVAREIKKIYVGVDGIARLAWQNVVMPKVGDLITMNLDGSDKQYRVIQQNGTVAKVITMHDVNAGMEFTNTEANDYFSSYVQGFLENYYYTNLSDTAKTALIYNSIKQEKWSYDDSGNPSYVGFGGLSASDGYEYYYSRRETSSYGSQHVFAPSIQDIIDYFSIVLQTDNPRITNLNLWVMLWNQYSNPGNVGFWLRDGVFDYPTQAFCISGLYGQISYDSITKTYPVRACFQIDLSKIDFTIN